MPERLLTRRPAPWLHAAANGAFISLAVVFCRRFPGEAWLMAPVGFAWSRVFGWLMLRHLFRKTRSPIMGAVEFVSVQQALHEAIHNFINGLSVLQGDVDIMILRAGRLKAVFQRMTEGENG